MSDESEAERMEQMHGVGDVNYITDEEVRGYSLADFNNLGPNGLGGL